MALVNYYRQGDTLGGHKDDVEQDKTAPIVALSLGCDAIFLLGGRDPSPLSVFRDLTARCPGIATSGGHHPGQPHQRS